MKRNAVHNRGRVAALAGLVLSGCAAGVVAGEPGKTEAASPIVVLPAQPGTATLALTIGADGTGRHCRVVQTSGDVSDDARACRYFSRAGHPIKTDKDGRPMEYERQFGVAPSFLTQLRNAFP